MKANTPININDFRPCSFVLAHSVELLQDIGYAGWRLDFVKGYAPEYVKEYIKDTVGTDTFHVSVSSRRLYVTTIVPFSAADQTPLDSISRTFMLTAP